MLLWFLAPDEFQASIYSENIEPNLKQGVALAFAHGLNIHFDMIVPREDLDVIMIAPKAPGHTVRSEFVKGGGIPDLIAVKQNASGNAKEIALSMPQQLVVEEQVFLKQALERKLKLIYLESKSFCAAEQLHLVQAGFETLVEAGYEPEMAYFECLHELKLIVDLLYEGGIANMRYSISNTAEYGDVTRGPRIVTEETKAEMKKDFKRNSKRCFC